MTNIGKSVESLSTHTLGLRKLSGLATLESSLAAPYNPGILLPTICPRVYESLPVTGRGYAPAIPTTVRLRQPGLQS